jgi:hypothetical protein
LGGLLPPNGDAFMDSLTLSIATVTAIEIFGL